MMSQVFYTLFLLFSEQFAARRDAQIRFLRAENTILKSRLKSRVICTPEERSLLLKIGAELNHQVKDFIGIVQFKTYCRWVREQTEGKAVGRVGRPRKFSKEVIELILRFAKENRFWGARRIAGELAKLGESVGKTSILAILRKHGHHPEPGKGKRLVDRDSTWQVFLRLHMNTLVACDFFSKTIWTPLGKRMSFSLFFIHLESRKVWVSPSTYHSEEIWMKQQAKNFLIWAEENDITLTHLIRDRDGKFLDSFDEIFKDAGCKKVKIPVRAPNANSFAEAWVATLKRSCLHWLMCFSLSHLDFIVYAFVDYYNTHRPHQSKGNRVLKFSGESSQTQQPSNQPIGQVKRHSSLGGLLTHYTRDAA